MKTETKKKLYWWLMMSKPLDQMSTQELKLAWGKRAKDFLVGNIATLSIDTTSIFEHKSATITAKLSYASTLETKITFAASGTATLNTDYKGISTDLSISIAAGDTVGTLTIGGIEDKLFSEGTETIILTPTSTNASLASSDAFTT